MILVNRRLKMAVPFVGVICDRVPTDADCWNAYSAFVYSFPSKLAMNLAAGLVVHVLLRLLFLCGLREILVFRGLLAQGDLE